MKTEYLLKKKLKEIYLIQPNDLGNPYLTKIYKKITPYFKVMPFIIVVPISLLFAFLMYFVFGPLIVKLASLLQYGF